MAGNLLPLVLIGGVAVVLSKKKKKKKGACPARIDINADAMVMETITRPMPGLEDGVEYNITKSMFDDYNSGSRDIVAMSKKALSPFIPEKCMASGSVKIGIYGEKDGRELMFTYKAPEVFFGIGAGFIEDMMEADLMDEDTGRAMWDSLVQWWTTHMGNEPIPEGVE